MSTNDLKCAFCPATFENIKLFWDHMGAGTCNQDQETAASVPLSQSEAADPLTLFQPIDATNVFPCQPLSEMPLPPSEPVVAALMPPSHREATSSLTTSQPFVAAPLPQSQSEPAVPVPPSQPETSTALPTSQTVASIFLPPSQPAAAAPVLPSQPETSTALPTSQTVASIFLPPSQPAAAAPVPLSQPKAADPLTLFQPIDATNVLPCQPLSEMPLPPSEPVDVNFMPSIQLSFSTTLSESQPEAAISLPASTCVASATLPQFPLIATAPMPQYHPVAAASLSSSHLRNSVSSLPSQIVATTTLLPSQSITANHLHPPQSDVDNTVSFFTQSLPAQRPIVNMSTISFPFPKYSNPWPKKISESKLNNPSQVPLEQLQQAKQVSVSGLQQTQSNLVEYDFTKKTSDVPNFYVPAPPVSKNVIPKLAPSDASTNQSPALAFTVLSRSSFTSQHQQSSIPPKSTSQSSLSESSGSLSSRKYKCALCMVSFNDQASAFSHTKTPEHFAKLSSVAPPTSSTAAPEADNGTASDKLSQPLLNALASSPQPKPSVAGVAMPSSSEYLESMIRRICRDEIARVLRREIRSILLPALQVSPEKTTTSSLSENRSRLGEATLPANLLRTSRPPSAFKNGDNNAVRAVAGRIRCRICDVIVSSPVNWEAHLSGKKHALGLSRPGNL